MTLESPTGPEDLTAEWLTEVLLQSGTIVRSKVATFTSEKIGDAGFIGELARLKLQYVGLEECGPPSIIVKFSNADAFQRRIFHGIGLYEREVRFYTEFARRSPLPTPACYHAEVARDTGRSVLLLEDLSHLRTIDVSAGCGHSDARALAHSLAEFHAYWWNHAEVVEQAHKFPVDRMLGIWHALYKGSWPEFSDRLRLHLPKVDLPAEFLELGDRLFQCSGDVFGALAEPPVTLVHMDIHLDNLAFDSPAGSLPPVVFDWQTCAVGRGVLDLAYFVISALPVAVRRQEEESLVATYHDLLVEHGVRGYAIEECWADYTRASLWNLLLLPGMLADESPSAERLKYVEAVLPRLVAFFSDHSVSRFVEQWSGDHEQSPNKAMRAE